MNSSFTTFYAALVLAAFQASAAAQTGDPQGGAGQLTEGIIASIGKMDKTVAIDTAKVASAVPGQSQNPVTGKLERDGDECRATVINRSDEASYALSYRLELWNEDGQPTRATA